MADASARGGGLRVTDAARTVLQQVFGDDSDSEQAAPETLPVVELEAAEEAEGAAAGEEEPVLNTKRAQKQSMRDKLQLLAQGRKAEDESKKTKRKVKEADEGPAKKGVARKRVRKAKEAAEEGGRGAEVAELGAAAAEEAPAPPAAPHADSEDDEEGEATVADAEFIDDEGAAEAGLESEGEEEFVDAGEAPQAAEAEEGEEDDIEALFKPKSSRAKAKSEAQLKEMRSEASDLVARMEVAAEQDAAARAEGQLAVAKLRELPDVERALCRVDLQPMCLEHGLLGALATWLRPGEDGSLPNLRIRTALLGLIARLPVDTRDPDSKEQLKRSGLGKVVMFYKLHDDAAANRAQAGRIVDEWSRPLFHLSAAYRDMAKEEAEVPTGRWAEGRSVALAEPEELEQEVARLGPKDSAFRHHAAIPEAARLDYTVRPKSAVSAPTAQRSSKEVLVGGRKIVKDLKGKKTRKASFAAHKVSVEGRNMILKD